MFIFTARILKLGLVPAVLAGALACATAEGLSRQDVLHQYDELAQLDAGLKAAQAKDAALLAPDTFVEAQSHVDEAVRLAQAITTPKSAA